MIPGGRILNIRKTFIVLAGIIVINTMSHNVSLGDTLTATSLPKNTILSGKALELKNHILSFLCDDGSIANIKWHDVISLAIDDKIYVTLDGKETFYGLASINDGKVNIESQSIGKVGFASQKITALERKRKDVSPLFVVSNSQELSSVRAKGTETPPRPSESKDEKPPEKGKEQAKAEKKTPTIGEKPDERIPEDMFLRDEKVLVPKGKGEIELNLTYRNRDSSDVFGPDKTRSLIPSITGRYGITNKLLGFVTVPFVFNWREMRADFATKNYRSAGLGDLIFGANYQLLDEGSKWPSLMLSLIAISNTGKPYLMSENKAQLGTGHWQISPGFSLVKSIDPVVLFGSLYYTYGFSETLNTSSGEETRKPGDSVNLVLGTGFAFNEKVTLSFKVFGSFIFRDRINGSERNDIRTPFYFYSVLDYMLHKRGYLEPSVGFGITKDAPDFLLSLSYIHRFY
jgi:hypothetical protein